MTAAPRHPYRIRRSTRARRVRVVVHPDASVEVVLPQRARERDAADAVVALDTWIGRRLGDVAALQARTAPPAGTLPYLGTLLTLVPEPGRTRVHRRGQLLQIPAVDPDTALERWYRRQAKDELVARMDTAAAAVGRPYRTLSVRNQRTRWGSCSSTGAMSFNWRLLLAPEEILDYVVWHEACHLVHLDHSPRFWALVARHRPSFRQEQQWLARNGGGLRLPTRSGQPPSTRASAA